MSLNKRKIGFFFLAAVVMAAILARSWAPPVEKKLHVGYPSWPYHNLESAATEAQTIVCGEVVSKSGTKSHEVGRSSASGRVFLEYYREVKVRVITMVKGDPTARYITYLEPGGETADTIYRTDGVEEVVKGETYLFFLNKHGSFLSPATLMNVEDGFVTPSPDMCPDGESETILLDDYLAAIEEILA